MTIPAMKIVTNSKVKKYAITGRSARKTNRGTIRFHIREIVGSFLRNF